MLDFVNGFLEDKGPGLSWRLVSKLGFTKIEAAQYLRALACDADLLIRKRELDPAALLGGRGDLLLSKIDVDGAAQLAGIDEAMADAGACEIVPRLAEYLRTSGIVEALKPKPAPSGLSERARKLFGRK